MTFLIPVNFCVPSAVTVILTPSSSPEPVFVRLFAVILLVESAETVIVISPEFSIAPEPLILPSSPSTTPPTAFSVPLTVIVPPTLSICSLAVSVPLTIIVVSLSIVSTTVDLSDVPLTVMMPEVLAIVPMEEEAEPPIVNMPVLTSV